MYYPAFEKKNKTKQKQKAPMSQLVNIEDNRGCYGLSVLQIADFIKEIPIKTIGGPPKTSKQTGGSQTFCQPRPPHLSQLNKG